MTEKRKGGEALEKSPHLLMLLKPLSAFSELSAALLEPFRKVQVWRFWA